MIVAGDFNDETMELSEFKIFDIRVSVEKEARKRTCCSDRAAAFKKVFDPNYESDRQEERKTEKECTFSGLQVQCKDEKKEVDNKGVLTRVHTKANMDYFIKDCGYFNTEQEIEEWLAENPTMNPMSELDGAPLYLPSGAKGGSGSDVPFPSDMILSSKAQSSTPIEFPPGYEERMSKGGEKGYKKEACVVKGDEPCVYEGMISDHDPIQRTFKFVK